MVWVRPGKLPAKVIVAPNSPRARAQHSTAPAASEGATSGSVTRRNTDQPRRAQGRRRLLEPLVGRAQRALHRDDQERHRDEGLGEHDGRGRERDRHAEPVVEVAARRTRCARTRAAARRRPTTGGRTSGSVTSARTTRRPGHRGPRQQPRERDADGQGDHRSRPSPSTATATAPTRRRRSAGSSVSRPHGARTTSAASGSSRNASATRRRVRAAPTGARCDDPPRSARRARSAALIIRPTAHRSQRQPVRETRTRRSSDGLAVRREHVRHERLPPRTGSAPWSAARSGTSSTR